MPKLSVRVKFGCDMGSSLPAYENLVLDRSGLPRCNALFVLLSNANSAKNGKTRQLQRSASALV
jgi:hypothetical protein